MSAHLWSLVATFARFVRLGIMPMHSNDLLAALLEEDRGRLAGQITKVTLDRGSRLYEPGDLIEQCYFPADGAIAGYFIVLDDGLAVETATVGREGALGGIVSHGRLPAFARSSVLSPGTFLRIPMAQLEALKREVPAVDRLFNRYADCFVAQVFQSAACNASHTIEQRLARWLGAMLDRTGGEMVELTQEQLGELLGVGRTYASRVLQRFRQRGVIDIRRGRLLVRNRQVLDGLACSCNVHVKAHYRNVLGGIYAD